MADHLETEFREDRPTAVLTDAQREYLRGEREIDGADERMMRSRIRKRLKATIFDVDLITGTLPLKDLDKALSEPDDIEMTAGSVLPLSSRMPSLVSLLYLANRELETSAPDRSDGWKTATDVGNGIEQALLRLDVDAEEIEVSIRVDRGDSLQELAKRDELSTLSRDQLTRLLRAGLITGEEHAEAWSKKKRREQAENTDDGE